VGAGAYSTLSFPRCRKGALQLRGQRERMMESRGEAIRKKPYGFRRELHCPNRHNLKCCLCPVAIVFSAGFPIPTSLAIAPGTFFSSIVHTIHFLSALSERSASASRPARASDGVQRPRLWRGSGLAESPVWNGWLKKDETREARKILRPVYSVMDKRACAGVLSELKQGKLFASELQRHIAFDFIPPSGPAGGLASGE
jgi:hypothetical protein